MSPSPAAPVASAKEARSPVAEAAALLAHDLNNQLALMLANIEFLDETLRERSDLDAEVLETVSISQASLQHMMTLVRNITDIARMEDPGVVAAPASTDVARLLRGLVREYRSLQDRGAVEVKLEIADALRAEVDAVLVKRIAHNLLANARRFVDKDGAVRLRAALEPSRPGEAGNGQTLVLSIANTGPGIAAERRPTLFDKYRVNPDGKLARGMGLYFCRLACEAHGGGMSLSSEPEFPTVMTARLVCGVRTERRPAAV
jgi:signal transduction histidine kinase